MQASLRIEGAAEALFTPDGKGVIVASASYGWSKVVATLYNLSTGQKIRTFDPYPTYIQEFYSMALSNDGKRLVAAGVYRGSSSGTSAYPGFMMWDVETGNIVRNAQDMATSKLPTALIFAPGDSLFVGTYRGGLIAYRTELKPIPPYNFGGLDSSSFTGKVYGDPSQLILSPGRRQLLSNDGALWDLTSRRLVEDLGDKSAWRASVISFRGNDQHFVAGNVDGVYLLSMDQEKPVKHIQDEYMLDDDWKNYSAVLSVASSSDGKLIAAGDNLGNIKIWVADSSRMIAVGKESLSPETVFFSPDDKAVMTVGGSKSDETRTVQIWMLPQE
jgi:WD40 repeat protein